MGGERGLDGRQFQSHCCAVRQRSIARFLAEILGLPFPKRWAPFLIVTTNNGTNLDFMNADGQVAPQHYAFLVSEAEFDEVFGRVRERSLPYWADPVQKKSGEINHRDVVILDDQYDRRACRSGEANLLKNVI